MVDRLRQLMRRQRQHGFEGQNQKYFKTRTRFIFCQSSDGLMLKYFKSRTHYCLSVCLSVGHTFKLRKPPKPLGYHTYCTGTGTQGGGSSPHPYNTLFFLLLPFSFFHRRRRWRRRRRLRPQAAGQYILRSQMRFRIHFSPEAGGRRPKDPTHRMEVITTLLLETFYLHKYMIFLF